MSQIDRCKKVPIAELTAPRNGTCEVIMDCWWVVSDESLLFFNLGGERVTYGTPQCNANERVARSLADKLYPGCEVRRIPIIYLEHDCHDYI